MNGQRSSCGRMYLCTKLPMFLQPFFFFFNVKDYIDGSVSIYVLY